MVRLAILGLGNIARVMARTVQLMNQHGDNSVKVVAGASRSKEKAEAFCREFSIEKAYGSYQELYDDADIDLVYIATPHSHHFEEAKACLESGKHVLCEKAFTVNAAMAEQLVALSKEKNLLLSEAIWTRYMPSRLAINEVIASGIIGQVTMVTANLSYSIAHVPRLVKPELAGGALLDVGVYPLNFACMILGEPDRVDAVCIKNSAGVDMSNSITLCYEKTAQMAVLCSSATGVSDRFGYIHGTKGFIQVENINNPQSLTVYNSDYQAVKMLDFKDQLTGYEFEVQSCVKAINEGRCECPQMPHDMTLYMMRLYDSIRAQLGIKYPFE
ncbi:MAG: Gfo/Idh/MocA family protein [Succinivibrio sp.]